MNLLEKKSRIKAEVDKTQEEWVIKAIEKLLGFSEDETPDWHLSMVQESLEEYNTDPQKAITWETIKRKWKDEL